MTVRRTVHRCPAEVSVVGVRVAAVVLVVLSTLMVGGSVAAAHETAPVGVQRVEVSLGERQLVVTITLPPAGGGAMPVVVLPRGAAPPGTVTVAAVPAGAAVSGGTAVPASPAGHVGRVVLDADRAGGWEVVLADGAATARIPVAVAGPAPTPGWVWAARIAAVVGVVALIVAVSPAVRRRRWRMLPVGALAVVALSVAATAAVLGGSIPAPVADGAGSPAGESTGASPMDGMTGMTGMTGMAGMTAGGDAGAVTLTMSTAPVVPLPGRPVDLELRLSDGSSGAVVDDLAVHDDALIHLAVVGPDRQLFHVHPARIGPGRYTARIVPGASGRYGVFAEMERAGDGGHQVARSAFDVGGAATPIPPSSGSGPGQVAGLRTDVSVPVPVAGRPARISVGLADGGGPVTDLQSWLGMAGHLMVLGPGAAGVPDPADPAATFGHVHDMSAANPNGRYGPQVGFDYTFPRAGRYQLWVQVQRDWQIVTVPVAVDVRPDAGAR